jgi:hypothetical protein
VPPVPLEGACAAAVAGAAGRKALSAAAQLPLPCRPKKRFLRGRTNLSSFSSLLFFPQHFSGNQGCDSVPGESVHSPETFRRTREAPFEFHLERKRTRSARRSKSPGKGKISKAAAVEP